MYTPPFNRIADPDSVRDLVALARRGWLVTTGADGVPAATLLPILWRDDTVIAHLAKANPQWREVEPDAPTLVIVPGPDAYVSPSWYATKTEHGRVVPTWNYSAVHLTGTARIHHDPDWLRMAVTELTDAHESDRESRWHVTDAPDAYVTGQLKGIVGVEVTVTRVEAKAKLSQNRSAADQRGVVDGLREEPWADAHAVADTMAANQPG